MKRKYAENLEASRTKALARYRTVRGLATHRLSAARLRARKGGLPFDLDADWIEERLRSGRCEATGITFVFPTEDRGSGHQHPWSPSLDRRDPALGYTKSNTRVVVWMYNAAKHVATDADLETLATAIVRRRT